MFSILILLIIKNYINRVLAIIHFYITTFILLFTGCTRKADCDWRCLGGQGVIALTIIAYAPINCQIKNNGIPQ